MQELLLKDTMPKPLSRGHVPIDLMSCQCLVIFYFAMSLSWPTDPTTEPLIFKQVKLTQ